MIYSIKYLNVVLMQNTYLNTFTKEEGFNMVKLKY